MLKHEKTLVIIEDQEKNTWTVEFFGTWKNLKARVYKNNHYQTTFYPRAGHANKTAAFRFVNTLIAEQATK